MSKNIIKLVPILFSIIVAFSIGEVSAVQCGQNECTDGWRICNDDDMCCTGDGCPSWVCLKNNRGGGDTTYTWIQRTNTCKICTKTLISKTCAEWGDWYIDDYIYKCRGVPCAYGDSDARSETSENNSPSDDDVLGEQIAYIPSNCTSCGWFPKWKRDCERWDKDYRTSCTFEKAAANDRCRYCDGEDDGNGNGNCTPAAITGKPTLNTPGNGDDLASTTTSVRLSWTAPNDWGKCCSSCSQRYEVWVRTNDGSWSKKATIAGTAYNLPVAEGNAYRWYIRAVNGDATALRSDVWGFEVLAEAPRVTGYIWDSTELACNSSKSGNEIKRADLEGNISVTVGGNNGTWNPANFDSYSYEVDGLTDGNNQTVCASVPAPKDKPNFKYNLSCLNNNSTGIISGSCATINVSGDTTAHLGFELTSRGWFHVVEGDVYAGCDECIDSVSMGIPDSPLGGFAGYLVDNPGAVFGNSDLSVKDSGGSDRYVSGGNEFYTKAMESNFWQKTFSFNPPSSTEDIAGGPSCRDLLNSGNLEAGKSYSMSRSCMQAAINNLSGNYRISGNGIATIFVESDGTSLYFDENFRTQNRNTRRLVIVSEADVDIDPEVGFASPTSSSRPNIEAAIITEGSINFVSNGTNDDTTVILEGPLVTKEGSIEFGRDRGLDNGYPAEVIIFNPIYLTAFDEEDETGLPVVDITWTLY